MKDIAKRVFDTEIESLRFVADSLNDEFTKVVEAVLAAKGKLIVIGIGKSGIIGKKIAAYAFQHRHTKFFFAPRRSFSW